MTASGSHVVERAGAHRVDEHRHVVLLRELDLPAGVRVETLRQGPVNATASWDAYLDLFKDKSVQVPWGTPCTRLEGSASRTSRSRTR